MVEFDRPSQARAVEANLQDVPFFGNRLGVMVLRTSRRMPPCEKLFPRGRGVCWTDFKDAALHRFCNTGSAWHAGNGPVGPPIVYHSKVR